MCPSFVPQVLPAALAPARRPSCRRVRPRVELGRRRRRCGRSARRVFAARPPRRRIPARRRAPLGWPHGCEHARAHALLVSAAW